MFVIMVQPDSARTERSIGPECNRVVSHVPHASTVISQDLLNRVSW